MWEYNAQDPTTALVAVYREEGAVNLDMTWSAVQGPGVTDVQHEAVVSIGRYLLSEDGQELLAGYGLRRIDAVVPDEGRRAPHQSTDDLAAGGREADRQLSLGWGRRHSQVRVRL